MLAVLVTVGALLALAVVIVAGPNGTARLWMGGGSSVTLKPLQADASGALLPAGPVGQLTGAPTTDLSGGVSVAGSIIASGRRGAVQLHAQTRVQRRTAAHTPSSSRPHRPAPANTPAPLQPVSQSTTGTRAPVATPAPGSTVVKSRGRGTTPAESEVPKQRVNQEATPAPTPAPGPSATPGPAPRTAAPTTEMRPVHPGGQPSTGVGAADGVLQRVPSTQP